MYTTLDGGLRDGAIAGLEEGVGPTNIWILRTLFSGNVHKRRLAVKSSLLNYY